MSDAYVQGSGSADAEAPGGPGPAGTALPGAATPQAGAGMAGALAAGLATLSGGATVRFVRYQRIVLPADGYVFWVKADLLAGGAAFGTSPLNSFAFGAQPAVAVPAPVLTVAGSLHVSSNVEQREDESLAIASMTFTTTEPVNDLHAVASDAMWIADWGGRRYAFSSRSGWYKQANLYHYRGDAVYPALETQIVDDPQTLDGRSQVVSNALPFFLDPTLSPGAPAFPSLLVPDNQPPPYLSVHIGEDDTRFLQPVPNLDANGDHWQLAADRVRVTVYGMRNLDAARYFDRVFETSRVYDRFGIMSGSVIKDAKRGQREFGVIAQKKTFEFEVSYYQTAATAWARQLIKTVIPSFIVAN